MYDAKKNEDENTLNKQLRFDCMSKRGYFKNEVAYSLTYKKTYTVPNDTIFY
ncbi:hypothetical protein ACER0A_007175 [Haloimpatiens sp. FM7315]|uniref:hypothetical protein n=1 Tax=Haloimpatiens sp. FM7315 TaxID=3298609 RepID=UPI00370A8848